MNGDATEWEFRVGDVVVFRSECSSLEWNERRWNLPARGMSRAAALRAMREGPHTVESVEGRYIITDVSRRVCRYHRWHRLMFDFGPAEEGYL